MKRVHYLLLGLAVSLCVAAVAPGGGTVIPGGAANAALLNGTNVFTGTNRFSSVVTATNTANTFAGNGAGLTGITATDATKLPLAGGTMTGATIQNNTAGNMVNTINSSAAGEGGWIFKANSVNKFELANFGSSHFGLYNFTTAGHSFQVISADNEFRINGPLRVEGSTVTFSANPTLGVGVITSTKASGNNNLVLDGTGEVGVVFKNTGAGKWQLYDNGTAFQLYNYTTAAHDISVLRASGNVGIGTTTPSGRLNVKASTSDSSATDFKILNSSGANLFSIRNDQLFSLGSGAANTQLTMDGSGAASGIYSPSYSSGSGNVILYKDYNGNIRMKLDMSSGTAGKLGIGTTSPASLLQVVGTGLTIGTAGTAVTNYYSFTTTLDFPSIATLSSADLVIAATGAKTNDTVTLGLPMLPAAGITWTYFVSSNGYVNLRAHNVTALSIDPASATYRVGVTSH